MDDGSEPEVDEFDFLTSRQAAVLDLLKNNRTSKEIAYALGISVPAVNRRIELLRSRLGGVTRHELVRRYRESITSLEATARQAGPGVETRTEIIQLESRALMETGSPPDNLRVDSALQDTLAMAGDSPGQVVSEPRVVPRVLDGENATLTRGAAITIILIGILASLVLVVAAAQSIAEVVG